MEDVKEFRIAREMANKSTKSVSEALKGNSNTKIFEEILSMEKFEQNDLKLFDDFFAIRKIDSDASKELYFEAFVKISGIELMIQSEIILANSRHQDFSDTTDFNLENPLIFSFISNQRSSQNFNTNMPRSTLFLNSKKPFSEYKIYKIAKDFLNQGEKKISILAYLICIDKDNLYTGEFELFYFLDFLLKENCSSFHLNNDIKINDLPATEYRLAADVEATLDEIKEVNLHVKPKELQDGAKSLMKVPENKITEPIKTKSKQNSSLQSHGSSNVKVFCKGEIKTVRGEILVNWSKNSKIDCKAGIFSFETKFFMYKEILLLNDFESLIQIIKIKKSHEILYLRLKFISAYLSENKSEIESVPENIVSDPSALSPEIMNGSAQINGSDHLYYLKMMKESIIRLFSHHKNSSFTADLASKQLISQNTKLLTSIIIDSFSEYNPYTESILLDLNSEYITLQLIYKTKLSIPCFYSICTTVDPLYIECFNICMDRLDLMTDEQLKNVIKSTLFKVYNFENFKSIVTRIIQSNETLPISCLLRKTKNSSNDKTLSWKVELIHRINFVIDFLDDKNSILSIAKESITKKNVDLSISLVFKIRNFSLFKSAFDHLVVKDNELMASIDIELKKREFSVFYYRVANFLIQRGHLSSFSFFDCSPYSQAIKKKLIENRKIKKILLDKDQNISKQELKESIKNADLTYSKGIVEGLYFNKSYLSIDKPYKKFILAIELTVYKEHLNDMELVRFGNDFSLEIESGDIKIRKNETLRKIQSLNEIINQKDSEVSGENAETNDESESKIPLDVKSHQNSNLILALSNVNLSKLMTEPENSTLTPISLKFKIINTGKTINIKLNNGRSIEITNTKIDSICINEKFYGVLKTLLYAETHETYENLFFEGDQPDSSLFLNTKKFFDSSIKPIDKLLDYKRRKGVYLDKKGIYYLGKKEPKGFITKKNIMEM